MFEILTTITLLPITLKEIGENYNRDSKVDAGRIRNEERYL